MSHSNVEIRAYVGTYTDGQSILCYRFDPQTGELSSLGAYAGGPSPSFLALHRNGRVLYAVNEVGEFEGKRTGAVAAFAVESGTGALTLLNRQSSKGSGPCHLTVDASSRYAIVANYGSGSVAMLPIRNDGSLDPASDFHQHEGSSVDKGRQEGPHTHSVTVDPNNAYVVAADLGLDRVLIYRIDDENGKLVPNPNQPFAAIRPGAGPRHFAFHPNGKLGYVINELDNTVTAFAYDGRHGTLREIQHIATLPDGYADTSYCADIHIHPNGRFLYGSNRGHDSIVVFTVADDGTLAPVQHEPTQGNFPRNFALDPSGNFLLSANQNGNNIVVFRVAPDTGRLAPTGRVYEAPKPVCIRFTTVTR
jgi:6-phosphogluconolactonase